MSDFNLVANLKQSYESPTQLLSDLRQIGQDNPMLSHFSVIGSTSHKRKISVLELSENMDNKDSLGGRIRVLFVGGLKGSKPVGTDILLRFARHLVTGK